MTKFQALYVLWLRHDTLQSCSWRALAGHFAARYGVLENTKRLSKRFVYDGFGGNQIDGMMIEAEAFKLLRPNSLFMESPDLFECDLTLIDANLKRHIK